jgi:hypothetical protein
MAAWPASPLAMSLEGEMDGLYEKEKCVNRTKSKGRDENHCAVEIFLRKSSDLDSLHRKRVFIST